MHFIMTVLSKNSPKLIVILFLGFLVACGSSTELTPEPTNEPTDTEVQESYIDTTAHTKRYPYVTAIVVDQKTKRKDIQEEYGGKIVMHKPKTGFAIIAFSEEDTAAANTPQEDLTSLAKGGKAAKLERNLESIRNPASANGFSAWSNGFSAWSNGFSAWSNGFSAWSNGDSAPPPPTENEGVWNKVRLNQAYQLSANYGEGVVVAVIDTGIDLEHPVFENRLTPKQSWKDYIDDDTTPQDMPGGLSYGHGTAVAGIVLQVAPLAKILPIRVLNSDGKGDLLNVALAVEHAISNGANVINLSLGAIESSDLLLSILQYARDNGVYVIAAAGNNGEENALDFPAKYAWWTQVHPYLMSVSSVDDEFILSDFSAYGDQLVVSAPGENIISAYPGGQMAKFTGTSFATPLLTGAIALAYADTSDDYRSEFFSYIESSVCCSDIWDANRAQVGTDRLGVGVLDIVNLLRKLPTFDKTLADIDPANNLIINSSFELGSADSWDSSNITIDSQNQLDGDYAAKLGAGEAWVSKWIHNLEPNTTYSLAVWLKQEKQENEIELRADSFDENQSRRGVHIKTVSSDYSSASLNFTTGSDSTTARITFWKGWSETAIYVDGFSLVKLSK